MAARWTGEGRGRERSGRDWWDGDKVMGDWARSSSANSDHMRGCVFFRSCRRRCDMRHASFCAVFFWGLRDGAGDTWWFKFRMTWNRELGISDILNT
jgi:hypothetical protein